MHGRWQDLQVYQEQCGQEGWVRNKWLGYHGKMEHMFSILAAHRRFPWLSFSRTGRVTDVMSPWESFLPTQDDVGRVKESLVVLVSWMLNKYFKSLSPLSKAVPQHISHQYSAQMREGLVAHWLFKSGWEPHNHIPYSVHRLNGQSLLRLKFQFRST